jgi:hypothetical protein
MHCYILKTYNTDLAVCNWQWLNLHYQQTTTLGLGIKKNFNTPIRKRIPAVQVLAIYFTNRVSVIFPIYFVYKIKLNRYRLFLSN